LIYTVLQCTALHCNDFFQFKGVDAIPCREIGYILRSLGQNPTENEIIALVCEAGCDWEGYLTRLVRTLGIAAVDKAVEH
jgi:hypothetical protein